MLRPSARLKLRDVLYAAFSRTGFNELLEALDLQSNRAEAWFGNAVSKGTYMLNVLRELGNENSQFEGIQGRPTVLQQFLELVLDRTRDRNPQTYEELHRLLAAEGIEIGRHGLQAIAGDVARPVEEENALFDRLREAGLEEVIRYLEQSRDNYLRENWEASNAMTRTAFDTVVTRIAEAIAQRRNEQIPVTNPRGRRAQPSDIRNYLRRVGFLNGNEFNLADAFYQVCSSAGPHPGLSHESDCRLRRFMLVGLCLEYLEKFSNWP